MKLVSLQGEPDTEPAFHFPNMAKHLPHYIRMYRKRAGLTQADVECLLGCRGGNKVSKCERFNRRPDLDTVLMCEAIFRVPANEIFKGMFRDQARAVSRRARLLARRLRRQPDTPANRRKLAFLDELIHKNLPRRP